MYVIFPLEDLLDPYSGLSRRRPIPEQAPPTQQIASQNKTTNQTLCNSPPTSSSSTQPSQVTVTPSFLSTGSVVASTDISRSGSIKSQLKCPSSAFTSQEQQQQQQQQSSSLLTPKNQQQTAVQRQGSIKKVTPGLQNQEQTFASSSALQNKAQVPIAATHDAASKTRAGVSRQNTTFSVLTSANCDSNVNSTISPSHPAIGERNSWPKNTNPTTTSSVVNNLPRSHSVRNKQPIRPLLSHDSQSTTLTETVLTPSRKTVTVDSPHKDLLIKQKSEQSGAKDCGGISAKEFNNHDEDVSCSNITNANKEILTTQVLSPVGSGGRTGGLVRQSSFSNRDLVHKVSVASVNRSNSSVSEQTITPSGGGFYSARSSSSSARSRSSEGRNKTGTLDSIQSNKAQSNFLVSPRSSTQESPKLDSRLAVGQDWSSLHKPIHTKSKHEVQFLSGTSPPKIHKDSSFNQTNHPTKIVEDLSSYCPPPKFAQDLSLQRRGGLSSAHEEQILSGRPKVGGGPVMASAAPGSSGEAGLRYLTHPALNETLKAHNNVTFKLLKTVSDFSAQLSRLHEHHAEQLQHLVHTYRKKNSELRNERPTPSGPVVIAWESLLQEVEVDSQLHVDIAATLTREVARPLVENTFHRKIEARKVFAHRESFDVIINKAEEQLKKHKREYTEAYRQHCLNGTTDSLARYINTHNDYVIQLRATNGMLTEYHSNTLPTLLQELESVLIDVGNIAASSLQQASEIIAAKTGEQHQRYQAVSRNCRNVDGRTDVSSMVKSLDLPNPPRPLHRFTPPSIPLPTEGEEGQYQGHQEYPQTYHNEVVEDRLSEVCVRARLEDLSRESVELQRAIQQNLESCEALVRAQHRSLDAGHHNRANELQEDISLKRFDVRVAQMHMGAIKAQRELFAPREGLSPDGRERKMSSSSTGSMKSKWMKAFKSLKTSSSTNTPPKEQNDRRGGVRSGELSPGILENSHIFQEYTYKKISACDVCHQILKGHSRQGLKCKLCKVNVHPDCQGEAPRCQPKSRLLRRQRSTSEIESKHIEIEEDEGEAQVSFNSLIASQPGRRTLEPPSPTGHGSLDHASKRNDK